MVDLGKRVGELEKHFDRDLIKMPDKLMKHLTGKHVLVKDEVDKLFDEWIVKATKAFERGSVTFDEFMAELPPAHQEPFIQMLKEAKKEIENQ